MKLEFTVHGTAKPQGSKRAIMGPNQKFPSVVESAGKDLKQWRYSVAQHAAKAMDGRQPITDAVDVEITFLLPRPKGHFGTGKNAGIVKQSSPIDHITKPDIDKLARAVCDSLSERVFKDDSQIVRLTVVKAYTDTDPQAIVRVTVAATSVLCSASADGC